MLPGKENNIEMEKGGVRDDAGVRAEVVICNKQ